MTKLVKNFNDTQAERQLIEQMQKVISVEDAKKVLKSAEGVMVPSIRDTDGTGYDIFSLLLKERIVMCTGQVESGMASVIMAQLKFLDSDAHPGKGLPITMLIDSPGGSVIAGFAIMDVMKGLESEVHTVGVGLQASMGSQILAAGDKRFMTERASLMIHGAASQTEGKVTQQHNDLNAVDRLVEMGNASYVANIGLTAEFWDLCDDEAWFNAEQALEMGFIHGVVPNSKNPNKQPLAEASAKAFLAECDAARRAKVPATEAEILTALHGKLGNQIRPELLVALSKCETFWTPELKALKQKQGAVNDNAAKLLKAPKVG